MRVIALLPAVEPEAGTAARIRGLCHAALAHRSMLQERCPAAKPSARRVLEPAVIASFSVLYLFDVLLRALALWGL